MIKLPANYRLRIPNSLAFLAALLLIVASAVGTETSQDKHGSGQQHFPSSVTESSDTDGVNDGLEKRRRGLNLGLLLFRRG